MEDFESTRDDVEARASQLYEDLDAPDALVDHLRLVTRTAAALLNHLHARFGALEIDAYAVLFGAATHDIGKSAVPAELHTPGDRHELRGERLLLDAGISPRLARFARTHGRIDESATIEDRLVALADKLWRGRRDREIEDGVIAWLEDATGQPGWEIFRWIDALADELYVGVEG